MAASSSANILNGGIIRAGNDDNMILIDPQIGNSNIIKHSGEINTGSVEKDVQGNIRLVAQQDIILDADSKRSANN